MKGISLAFVTWLTKNEIKIHNENKEYLACRDVVTGCDFVL